MITGVNESVHVATVRKVLERLRNAGLLVKREKSTCMLPKITYLDHDVDATGIHPTDEKICAIKEAPIPEDVTELEVSLEL